MIMREQMVLLYMLRKFYMGVSPLNAQANLFASVSMAWALVRRPIVTESCRVELEVLRITLIMDTLNDTLSSRPLWLLRGST